MKKAIRRINDLFISLILIPVYFIMIGFAFVLLKISEQFQQKKSHSSYWIKDDGHKNAQDYFSSAY
jgi:hypothetical protein